MKTQMQAFGLALQFMTRLPVPWRVDYTPEAQAASARFYPLVGLVIGAIVAAIYALAAWLWPGPLAAVMALGAGILVTGGLHEDGLADTADGLGGGATKERVLEIMRDSAIGVYGVLALVVSLAALGTALASFSVAAGAAALALGHGLSRYAPVFAIYFQSYARAEGAKFAAPELDRDGHMIAAGTTLVLALAAVVLLGWSAIAGLFAAALLPALLMRRYMARLGGFTGDCLGATQNLAFVGFLVGIAACH